MRIKIGYLLVFSILTVFSKVSAQEKLLLLNGKELLVQPMSLKEDSSRLEFKEFLNGKKKSVKKENAFSFKDEKGVEKVYYREDSTSLTHDLSLGEMRSYIQGMQEGGLYYKAPFATVGGFLIGAVSGYYLYFYSLIPPGTYIAVIGNHQPDMNKQKV